MYLHVPTELKTWVGSTAASDRRTSTSHTGRVRDYSTTTHLLSRVCMYNINSTWMPLTQGHTYMDSNTLQRQISASKSRYTTGCTPQFKGQCNSPRIRPVLADLPCRYKPLNRVGKYIHVSTIHNLWGSWFMCSWWRFFNKAILSRPKCAVTKT